jgi:hypothetical protein
MNKPFCKSSRTNRELGAQGAGYSEPALAPRVTGHRLAAPSDSSHLDGGCQRPKATEPTPEHGLKESFSESDPRSSPSLPEIVINAHARNLHGHIPSLRGSTWN